jgi:hypothetical protein
MQNWEAFRDWHGLRRQLLILAGDPRVSLAELLCRKSHARAGGIKARQGIRRPTADLGLCQDGRGLPPKAGRRRWSPLPPRQPPGGLP